MRYIFYFWFLPLSLLWGWFGLSYYDINFGTVFLSREMHDLVFAIYGSILNVEPATIVSLLVRACIIDTALIFGIYAFRKRREINAWWQARQNPVIAEPAVAHDPAE